jgi:hypothetical protein
MARLSTNGDKMWASSESQSRSLSPTWVAAFMSRRRGDRGGWSQSRDGGQDPPESKHGMLRAHAGVLHHCYLFKGSPSCCELAGRHVAPCEASARSAAHWVEPCLQDQDYGPALFDPPLQLWVQPTNSNLGLCHKILRHARRRILSGSLCRSLRAMADDPVFLCDVMAPASFTLHLHLRKS